MKFSVGLTSGVKPNMIEFKTETGNSDVIEAVKRSEERRLNAMRANDAATLKELLADDLVYVFSTGFVENKTGYLAALERGTTKYEDDLHIRDVEIRAFSENAVLTGVLETHILLDGERQHLVNRFTMLWVKNENNWQMSTWQSTPVASTSEESK